MIRVISRVHAFLKNRTKLIRKRSAYRFKIFLKYHLNRKEKESVFIIATRRTGSNLLLDYLNSIPNVSFAPEILNKSMAYGIRRRLISKKAVLRHIDYSINNCKYKTCGTKLIMAHLEYHQITLEDLKHRFPKARFIILYRRSILDQFISLKIAEATDTWHWTDQFCLPSSIRVRVPTLLDYCRKIKGFYETLFSHEWLKERSIVLSYEALVESPQEIFKQTVFPFLGLSDSRIAAAAKKQNTKALHEIVQNHKELVRWIKDPLTTQDYSFSREEQDDSMRELRTMAG